MLLACVQESILDQEVLSDWDNLIWPVTLLLAEATGDSQYHDQMQQAYLAKWLCRCAETAVHLFLKKFALRAIPAWADPTAMVLFVCSSEVVLSPAAVVPSRSQHPSTR